MGRGCRKGTLMKALAELPSLRLRYWDWRLCLAARLDVSLSASYFQAQTAFRPEPWLHQVRIWSQRGGGQHTVTGPQEPRAGLGGVSLLHSTRARRRRVPEMEWATSEHGCRRQTADEEGRLDLRLGLKIPIGWYTGFRLMVHLFLDDFSLSAALRSSQMRR